MPLAKSIGGFIRDAIMIAMGDMAKIMVELYFLAGSSLLKKRSPALQEPIFDHFWAPNSANTQKKRKVIG